MREINEVFYVDYTKAEENYMKDANHAAVFLMDQLNKISDDEVFSDGFVWAGNECSVNATSLNTTLKMLETAGLNESVIIIPDVSFGGPNKVKRYILKPYMYNTEVPVKVGIAVQSI